MVGEECRHLSQVAKSRLAFSLTACHLHQLGQAVEACKQSMSLKQCADSMDDRGYNTYLKFLAEIDRYLAGSASLLPLSLPVGRHLTAYAPQLE